MNINDHKVCLGCTLKYLQWVSMTLEQECSDEEIESVKKAVKQIADIANASPSHKETLLAVLSTASAYLTHNVKMAEEQLGKSIDDSADEIKAMQQAGDSTKH